MKIIANIELPYSNLIIIGIVNGEGFDQVFRKLLQRFWATDFLRQERQLDDMEIFVKLAHLVEVLLLHLATRQALITAGVLVREQKLIDNYVVSVNVVSSQFLDHAFGFVETQEFRNADTDKGGHIGILELTIDFLDDGAHFVNLGKEGVLVHGHAHHAGELLEHATKTAAKLRELAQSLLHNRREGQETQGVSRGRGIKDND